MNKTIVTVTGIRPDFIRMSSIFKKLDENFNHILIHTGQHYDKLLSDVFFDELEIRKPDYNLSIGKPGSEHFHQTADLSIKLIKLLRKIDKVDCIIFLGDSNSVCIAPQLKKEGFKIAHIEAGMRSYDKRMFEEINRIVCDHCSDYLFVYHNNYVNKLRNENIKKNVYNVGNTIVEVLKNSLPLEKKENKHILLDIHRPENFLYKERLFNILYFANECGIKNNLKVKLLHFKRTINKISESDINLQEFENIELVDLMPYNKFINQQYHAKFIISDSGTAQEEPSLLKTPVIVPRDFTERPESVEYGCSIMVDANEPIDYKKVVNFIDNYNPDNTWLGTGNTSNKIINILKKNI